MLDAVDHDRIVRLLAQVDDALDAQQVLAALARYDFQCERQGQATDRCVAYQAIGLDVAVVRWLRRERARVAEPMLRANRLRMGIVGAGIEQRREI